MTKSSLNYYKIFTPRELFLFILFQVNYAARQSVDETLGMHEIFLRGLRIDRNFKILHQCCNSQFSLCDSEAITRANSRPVAEREENSTLDAFLHASVFRRESLRVELVGIWKVLRVQHDCGNRKQKNFPFFDEQLLVLWHLNFDRFVAVSAYVRCRTMKTEGF